MEIAKWNHGINTFIIICKQNNIVNIMNCNYAQIIIQTHNTIWIFVSLNPSNSKWFDTFCIPQSKRPLKAIYYFPLNDAMTTKLYLLLITHSTPFTFPLTLAANALFSIFILTTYYIFSCKCISSFPAPVEIGLCCICEPDNPILTCDVDLGHNKLNWGVVYGPWNKLLNIIRYAASVKCTPSQ